MPAQVVIVLPDSAELEDLAGAIRVNGHSVQTFADPLPALEALEQARRIELLITSVKFPPGKSNGQALALMTRMRRPRIKVIFICPADEQEHIADLGYCLPPPVDVQAVAALVEDLLSPEAA